jgi:hypothetical protein
MNYCATVDAVIRAVTITAKRDYTFVFHDASRIFISVHYIV